MSWWPWQSGRGRNQEQRDLSLKRLTASTNRMLDAASADNQQAALASKAAVERRAQLAAPLRPLLQQIIERVADRKEPS